MQQLVKDFSHGLSFGIFKSKFFQGKFYQTKLSDAYDNVTVSISDKLDNSIEYLDDNLAEMQLELDILKAEDRWAMRLFGWLLYIAVLFICAMEFLFQLAGVSFMEASLTQILWASVGSAGALFSLPAARMMMKKGVGFAFTGLATLIWLFCCFMAFYVMFSTSSQTNSNRIGTQNYQATNAISNTKRLETALTQQASLEAKNLKLGDQKILDNRIAGALASKVYKGRTLSYLTSDCNAARIRRRVLRRACAKVAADRAVLSDITNLITLNAAIPELRKTIAGGSQAVEGDIASGVVSKISGMKRGDVQTFTQLWIAALIALIIFLSEPLYYHEFFKKQEAVKMLERNLRLGSRKFKAGMQQAADQAQKIAVTVSQTSEKFLIKAGSRHEAVLSFLTGDDFELDGQGKETVPELNKAFTRWRDTQGFPGMLVSDFRKTVQKLYKEKLLPKSLVLDANGEGVFVLKGIKSL